MLEIINSLFSGLIAAILSGLFFTLLQSIRKLKDLIAILIALENECNFNSRHRGDTRSQFQLYWFEKALMLPEFYEYAPEISLKCLGAFEYAKDANSGNLNSRTDEKNHRMVASDVQTMMIEISKSIKEIIPSLNKQADFWQYLLRSINNLKN